ncbi:hypothetical protein [Pseudodesulfovibrio karagichevae]|uniref:hypothetical protein n=1 Tax=Pseudodesulfovibrio karagichevae TaxID=3239305 RepID=UPI00352AFAC2
MVLEYEYSKYKLPQKDDRAYPVRKAEVDHALSAAEVKELQSLFFSIDYKDNELVVVAATFFGESRSGYWKRQKPELGIYAVPKELLATIKSLLDTHQILTGIAQWIKRIESASNVVRDIPRARLVYFKDGGLFVKDEKNNQVKLP